MSESSQFNVIFPLGALSFFGFLGAFSDLFSDLSLTPKNLGD